MLPEKRNRATFRQKAQNRQKLHTERLTDKAIKTINLIFQKILFPGSDP
jgi:hypothetical protein